MNKKILALMCALVFVVALVPCESVSAYESSYTLDSVNDDIVSKYGTSYYGNLTLNDLNYIVFEINGYVWCVVGGDVIYSNTDYNDTSLKLAVVGFAGGSSMFKGALGYLWDNSNESFVYKFQCGSPTTFYIGNASDYDRYGFDNESECLSYLSSNDIRVLACSQTVYDSSGNLIQRACGFGWDNVYNGELGYLDNIILKSLVLTDSAGVQTGETFRKVMFDYYSTSGVDLRNGDYRIRVYESVCYYKGYTKDVYDDFFPIVNVGEYAINDNYIQYDIQEAFNITSQNTDTSRITAWDIFFNTLVRSDHKYYQIVKYNDDGTCEYGGYVKISYPGDDSGYIATTTTDGINTSIENGGYIEEDVPAGVGSGTNTGDADLDADEDLTGNGDGVLDDVTGTKELMVSLQGVVDFVGSFPSVIGACLGFLPAWLQGLIYSAIGLGVILFIWKIVT